MVTINDPNVGLSFLAGRGDGTFEPPVIFPNSSRLDAPVIAAVDLNNDQNLDVVIGHQVACFTAPCVVGRTITVMLGTGTGAFLAPREVASRINDGGHRRRRLQPRRQQGSRARERQLAGVRPARRR